jgi:hypothetical protein
MKMNDSVEIRIDMLRIPEHVGTVHSENGRHTITIHSMRELRKWIESKVPSVNLKKTFTVTGNMPNCIALQLGLWLAGRGEVWYESGGRFRRKMDSGVEL